MESVPSVVILCLMTIPWSLFHQWSFSVWWWSHGVCSISGHSLTIPLGFFPPTEVISLITIPWSLCSCSGHSLSDDYPMEPLLCHRSFSGDPIRILSSNTGWGTITIPWSLCSSSSHSLSDDKHRVCFRMVILCLMTIPWSICSSSPILCLMTIQWSLCSSRGHSLSDIDAMESCHSLSNDDTMESLLQQR